MLLNAEEGKGCMRSLLTCVRSLTQDFLGIHLSPRIAAPALGLEFLFDCHARHSRLRAHPRASAVGGPADLIRNLLLKGLWSAIASSSSCAHRLKFDWTTSHLGAARNPPPPLYITHPVTHETLCCSCVWNHTFINDPSVTSFLSLLHVCQVCVDWCLWLATPSRGSRLKLIGDTSVALS